MTRTVDFYEIHPDELRPGDQMFVTVKLMIGPNGYRVYRCHLGQDQGARVSPTVEKKLAQELFPVVIDARIKRDTY